MAAAERRTGAEAEKVLERLVWNTEALPVTDPVLALQLLAGRLQHAADVLGGRLDVEDLSGPMAMAWAKVLRELRQALVSMEQLDLNGKQLVIDGALAEVVVGAYRASVAAVVLLPADRERLLSTFLGKLGDVVPGEVVA